jgi:hypothetical protein
MHIHDSHPFPKKTDPESERETESKIHNPLPINSHSVASSESLSRAVIESAA